LQILPGHGRAVVQFSAPIGQLVFLNLSARGRHYQARIEASGQLQNWTSPHLPKASMLTVEVCTLSVTGTCAASPQSATAISG
jgi:hypothetical protein